MTRCERMIFASRYGGFPAGQIGDHANRLTAAPAGLQTGAVAHSPGSLRGMQEVEGIDRSGPAAPQGSPCGRAPRCGRRTSRLLPSSAACAAARRDRPGTSSRTAHRSAPLSSTRKRTRPRWSRGPPTFTVTPVIPNEANRTMVSSPERSVELLERRSRCDDGRALFVDI